MAPASTTVAVPRRKSLLGESKAKGVRNHSVLEWMDTENGSRIKYGWLPFHTCSIRWVCKWHHFLLFKHRSETDVFWGKANRKLCVLMLKGYFSIWNIAYNAWFMMVYEFSAGKLACVEVGKVTLGPYRRFELLQELEPIYKMKHIFNSPPSYACILHIWSDSYKEKSSCTLRDTKNTSKQLRIRSYWSFLF